MIMSLKLGGNMFTPLVHTPGGSYVVVHITPDIYIDARKSEVYPNVSFIEEVVNGKVKTCYTVPNEFAPETIMIAVRDYAKRLHLC